MGVKHVCVFLLVLMTVMSVYSWPARKNKLNGKNKIKLGECDKFAYCKGEAFSSRVRIGELAVACESDGVTKKDIRKNCCLPQQSHLVCYGIEVEGDKLNFSNDTSGYLTSTDYTNLCKKMVEAEGRTPGTFNSATFLPEGGELAFRYGGWIEVTQPSERHIHNIACGVLN